MKNDKIVQKQKKKREYMKEKPQFADYIAINLFNAARDPLFPTRRMLDYLFFKVKTICSKCHAYKTFKLIKNKTKGDCFTIKCACGVDIIYPESEKRDNCRLWVSIPKDEYNKENGKNGNSK